MIRYRYNRQTDPPAPFLNITINRHDETNSGLNVPSLVDTGADKTVIPLSLAEELDLVEAGVTEAAGMGQQPTSIPLFLVRIVLHEFTPIVIEVLAVPGEPYVLLGRDILNNFRITLDGPALLCTIE